MLTTIKVQKFISILFIVAFILSSLHAPVVSAQSQDGLKRQVNAESGKVSFISPESGPALPAARALGTFLRPQDPAMALARRFAPEFGIQDAARELSEVRRHHRGDGDGHRLHEIARRLHGPLTAVGSRKGPAVAARCWLLDSGEAAVRELQEAGEGREDTSWTGAERGRGHR